MIKFFRLSILMAMIAVVVTGCGDDEKENQPAIKPQSQEALTQTVYADQTDGKSGVTFVTTGPWTSTIKEGTLKSVKAGTDPWVSIDPASGDKAGTYTITIKLEPNATGEDRSANIIITCDGTDITITVTQKGIKEDGTKYERPKQMSMSVYHFFSFRVAGSGTATIDWGDGTASETHNLDGSSGSNLYSYSHSYSIESGVCTLIITSDNITHLDVQKSFLHDLDVSQNTALTHLSCFENELTSLDVSKNTALTYLDCSSNFSLTSLDIGKNTALTTLYCQFNQLTSLDVSKCTALTTLNCYLNRLTSLDVNKSTTLTSLNCHTNKLTSLDVSGCTALSNLYCNQNQLASLNVSGCTALSELSCTYNNMTGAALDALFDALPNRVGAFFGFIFIQNNPGADACNPSIAIDKHWLVNHPR